MTLNEARDKLAEKFSPPEYFVRVKAESWSYTTGTKATDFLVSVGARGSGLENVFRQEGTRLEPLVEAALLVDILADNPAMATPEGATDDRQAPTT